MPRAIIQFTMEVFIINVINAFCIINNSDGFIVSVSDTLCPYNGGRFFFFTVWFFAIATGLPSGTTFTIKTQRHMAVLDV